MRVSERIFCSLLSDVDYIAKNNILGSMINKLDVLYAGLYMDQMSQTNNAAKGTMKESYRYYIYMPERIGWEMINIILSYIVLKKHAARPNALWWASQGNCPMLFMGPGQISSRQLPPKKDFHLHIPQKANSTQVLWLL